MTPFDRREPLVHSKLLENKMNFVKCDWSRVEFPHGFVFHGKHMLLVDKISCKNFKLTLIQSIFWFEIKLILWFWFVRWNREHPDSELVGEVAVLRHRMHAVAADQSRLLSTGQQFPAALLLRPSRPLRTVITRRLFIIRINLERATKRSWRKMLNIWQSCRRIWLKFASADSSWSAVQLVYSDRVDPTISLMAK